VSRLRALVVAAVLGAAPFAAPARPISEKDVQSGKVVRDPSQGYILVSGAERQFGSFLRVPDAETWATWNADRDKAWTKAQRRYTSAMKDWQLQAEAARDKQMAVPERPAAPTMSSLGIGAAELRDMESFGPFFAYGKDDRGVSYLSAVKPGTYIWYGPLLMGNNGAAAGSCYCLGSVRFEVKAGVITDLGNSLSSLPQWNDQQDVARLKLTQVNDRRVASGKPPLPAFATLETRYGLPASLASWPSVRAALQASPKMNNYFGLTVTRIAPIPGVLAYRRDVIVDARTGQEISSPTLISLVKTKK